MASAPFATGSNPASKVGADTLPGGTGLLTAPGPKVKEPDFNPFQVYAVRDLSELGDLINETVWTPEVVEVEKAVRGFVQAYGAPSDPVPRLLLAANGDFGTGKTHLMLFARATLYKEMEQKFGSKPKTPGLSRAPFVVLAPSSEAPVEDWFATELGPKLVEETSPRQLVRELLTRIACEVAESDEDPEIAGLAEEFRQSRKRLYQIFRDPDAFDVSEVEARFRAEVEKICPRVGQTFRRALEALRWEETSDFVEEWLAGGAISPANAERIGIRPEGDRAARAADTIRVIASLCQRLGRPFALFIDEFEHLTRHDTRHGSRRNITWVKRLVEALSKRGAVVFISGHWKAWKQQDDFLDRFVGRRAIQLVRLHEGDVTAVVEVRAGKGAWPGFTEKSARYVVEATSGNIRRVMTVLYDLWREPTAPTGLVTEEAVKRAAQRRLQSDSEIGIIPAIEAAVRGSGAQWTRDESFGVPPRRIDGSARLGMELRLIVEVVHVRDEVALFSKSSEFARLVKDARASNPQARGLCVVVGAVLEKQVLTLDAAFPETDLVNGERRDIARTLRETVERVLKPTPAPIEPARPESLANLTIARDLVITRADEQITRGQETFGSDNRSDTVREMSAPDAEELAVQKEESARAKHFQRLMEDLSPGGSAFFSALLRSWEIIVVVVTGGVCEYLGVLLSNYQLSLRSAAVPVDSSRGDSLLASPFLVPATLVVGALFILTSLVMAGRLMFEVRAFRKYRVERLERLYADGATSSQLSQESYDMEAALLEHGPRRARRALILRSRTGSPIGPNPPPSPSDSTEPPIRDP